MSSPTERAFSQENEKRYKLSHYCCTEYTISIKYMKEKKESNDISWLKLFLKDYKGGSAKDTDPSGNKTKT